MGDYHVFSMDEIGGKVTDHGVALDVKDVPWAGRQMWAPDAAYKDGTYYFYFPLKDKHDVFRIGVATSSSPAGPYKAQSGPHIIQSWRSKAIGVCSTMIVNYPVVKHILKIVNILKLNTGMTALLLLIVEMVHNLYQINTIYNYKVHIFASIKYIHL